MNGGCMFQILQSKASLSIKIEFRKGKILALAERIKAFGELKVDSTSKRAIMGTYLPE